MSLTDIKQLKKEKGFTIVELLIVIVVIAILAAIVLISYNGITQRANTTTAKANAEAVLKVAEAYAADTTAGNGDYPTLAELDGWAGGITQLPSGVALIATTLSDTHADGTDIQYMQDGDTGACVGYWDGTQAQYFYAGSATTASNAATPTCT